jgi:hypothetical protein
VWSIGTFSFVFFYLQQHQVDETFLQGRQLYALEHDGVDTGTGVFGVIECPEFRLTVDLHDVLFQSSHL